MKAKELDGLGGANNRSNEYLKGKIMLIKYVMDNKKIGIIKLSNQPSLGVIHFLLDSNLSDNIFINLT